MPTYTYECKNKNCTIKELDIDKKVSDSMEYICPECGLKMERVFKTSVGVNLNFKDSYNSTR